MDYVSAYKGSLSYELNAYLRGDKKRKYEYTQEILESADRLFSQVVNMTKFPLDNKIFLLLLTNEKLHFDY